ncbi:hypothetical protein QOZ80_2BG0152990 [Eleusine coracana subsp. coracana]|nr:hypothetical protein QOZ80_2BG0152990 [Eleusine coracana subsp. coracana]
MSSGGGGGKQVLLHGDLELTIHEARGLPNMDVLSTLLRRLCICPPSSPLSSSSNNNDKKKKKKKRSVSRDYYDDSATTTHHRHRHNHRHKPQPHGHHILPTSDPYAAVVVPPPDVTLARTHVVRNSEAPQWSTRVVVPLAHVASHILFQVKDADHFGSDLIGVAYLAADEVDDTCFWRDGIPAYFPLRRGCDVKLYQDAHVEQPAGGGCWEDLCLAILNAQHLVYIVGWSVHTQVRLLRESSMSPEMEEKAAEVRAMAGVRVEEMTLGHLLKYKSQEGVRVCLLVWDDKTSHDTFFFRSGGVMRTRDEDTNKFFRHSSVICVLSPRYPSSKLSMFRQKMVGTLYTHHQKCVLVDTAASESTRRITAFLGGLDLCAGRYDTPSHRLFRDADDDSKGPRQPWHDLHCRIDGPAAYDVLRNFEQRWRKATKPRAAVFGNKTPSHRWKDDALLKLERIPWILSPYNTARSAPANGAADDDRFLHALAEDNPECWHAQVFRSIDSGSAKGFPRTWETEEMEQFHLLCDKNVAVEQSIHTAYVHAIRCAQRFIYVENQYLIGSSYAWPSYRHPGASNLVPMEIALKVAAKIRAGERFAAYVVIPMWPEGNPGSGPAQEILFWQRQTMEMMYQVVATEIRRSGWTQHPQDYLNFYCLGNREVDHGNDNNTHEPLPPANGSRRHRRFMVYVHSKGMIVDDDYVIVGSANINQRSLAGSRDTEIAVGAYQPHHHLQNGGKVYGYRMSLWEEHLGVRRPEMDRPESPECVRMVNRIARENWARYVSPDVMKLQGHLMRYPVHVSADGRVSALPGHDTFPDVGGRILGSTNNLLDYLTM